MTDRIRAVYEKGVFRPTEPVSLGEGTPVELFVDVQPLERPSAPLINALLEIARMPSRSPNDGFSGADHDKVLYGPGGAR